MQSLSRVLLIPPGIGALLFTYHQYQLRDVVKSYTIRFRFPASDQTYLDSSTFIPVTNPYRNKSWNETVTASLREGQMKWPGLARGGDTERVRDERTLMALFRGFWGGWIFTPERYFLEWFWRRKGVDDGIVRELVAEKHGVDSNATYLPVYNDRRCLPHSLPPIGSQFWHGAFTVTETGRISSNERGTGAVTTYLDVNWKLFSQFAGGFRFAVTRKPSLKAGEDDEIELAVHCQVVNPEKKELWLPPGFYLFHLLYERLLFGDAVRNALNNRV